MDIRLGRSVELGLEFGVEAIDVANVDVVGEAAISRGCPVGDRVARGCGTRGFAMDVGVAFHCGRAFGIPKMLVKKASVGSRGITVQEGVTWMMSDMAATRSGDNPRPAAYRAFFFLEMWANDRCR